MNTFSLESHNCCLNYILVTSLYSEGLQFSINNIVILMLKIHDVRTRNSTNMIHIECSTYLDIQGKVA